MHLLGHLAVLQGVCHLKEQYPARERQPTQEKRFRYKEGPEAGEASLLLDKHPCF